MAKSAIRRENITVDATAFQDWDLECALLDLVNELIPLLDRRYADVLWRAEILDQSLDEIAKEMELGKQTITSRLRKGRRELVGLILLTLQTGSDW